MVRVVCISQARVPTFVPVWRAGRGAEIRGVRGDCAYARAMIHSSRSKSPALRAALALMLVSTNLAAIAADRLQSGEWESTLTTEGDSRTVKFCIVPAEAASMNGDAQAARDYAEQKALKAGGRCSVKSFTVKGNSVAYSLMCGDRNIENSQTYRGDSSNGMITTTVQGQPTVTTKVKSRRLGAC